MIVIVIDTLIRHDNALLFNACNIFFRGGSQLQIAKVKLEDSGVYSCKGRNVLGTSNVASVNVIVRDQGMRLFYVAVFLLFYVAVFLSTRRVLREYY
jgi:hypothetical protein